MLLVEENADATLVAVPQVRDAAPVGCDPWACSCIVVVCP